SRNGDFAGLLAVLDPDAVFRIDAGGAGPRARDPIIGAEAVARQVLARGRPFARFARAAIVHGTPRVVVAPRGQPIPVVGFALAHGRMVASALTAARAKLSRLWVGSEPSKGSPSSRGARGARGRVRVTSLTAGSSQSSSAIRAAARRAPSVSTLR